MRKGVESVSGPETWVGLGQELEPVLTGSRNRHVCGWTREGGRYVGDTGTDEDDPGSEGRGHGGRGVRRHPFGRSQFELETEPRSSVRDVD